jgi:hypothetical protein
MTSIELKIYEYEIDQLFIQGFVTEGEKENLKKLLNSNIILFKEIIKKMYKEKKI